MWAIPVLLALIAGAATKPEARPFPFEPATRGCAMAHCDPAMSDQAHAQAPGTIGSSWHDPSAATSSQGLGCSANGKIAVCTSGDYSAGRTQPYLKAYDGTGRVLWDSGTKLNAWAWTSAAMVDRGGGVIAADDSELIRFAPGGNVRWRARTPGGAPISPTLLENGAVVLATWRGPVSAFDSRNGRHLGTLDLRATLDGLPGRFDTTNTPGARGNRVYVSTEFTLDDGRADPNHHARLYAIDVDPSKPAGKRMRTAWHYDFGARSGASPLVVGDMIIFDGDRAKPTSPEAPRFFGVRDLGTRPKLVWEYELGGPGQASAAHDPRGGAWVFAFGNPILRRVSTSTGRVLQRIDLGALVGGTEVHTPWSAMTIATGRKGRPVMLVTARAGLTSSYLVAVDLRSGKAVWKYKLPGGVFTNTPMGQFPIVKRPDGRRAVVFSMRSGVRAVVGR